MRICDNLDRHDSVHLAALQLGPANLVLAQQDG